MTLDSKDNLKFEIGHVLFIDVVGYSKLLINEQSEQLQKLKETVRGAEQFRLAEEEDKLLRLPTGDGGALVFRTSPEAPVLCALDIGGPVNDIDDYPQWRPYLHDLGECEVKHGVRIGVVNLYREEIGNAQLPTKFAGLRKRHTQKRWAIAIAAIVLLAAIGISFVVLSRPSAETALAQVEVQVGEIDIAIAMFPHLLEAPNGLTPGLLRLDPYWDPLRKDPRFQKLSEEKPK